MKAHKYDSVATLQKLGISYDDATALRRISMTLHRWHELECGTENGAIQRDERTGKAYWYNANSRYLGANDPRALSPARDMETPALERLGAIMARYPALGFYVQGDPRGAALYILRSGDVPAGEDAGAYYSRGIVVCK